MASSLLDLVQPGQGTRDAVWGAPGQPGGADMQVFSSLLGNTAASIGSPTYDQILQGLLTSGTPEGEKAAGDYAHSIYTDFYTPGGSRDLFETGQTYAQANDLNYSGGGGSGNNWYPGAEPNLPAGQPSSGFTMSGADPFASANIGRVGGLEPWNIPTKGLNNRIPWQLRNTLGPAVVRKIMSQESTGPSNIGSGAHYPGSVAYAPYRPPNPVQTPMSGGQWTANMARDAWGRLLGASGLHTAVSGG
jgi:hypothetical protein